MIGDTTLTTHRMKYSAAYSKGRELMLEPLYGCAEEALLRRVASPYGESEGPSRGRARAYLFVARYVYSKHVLRDKFFFAWGGGTMSHPPVLLIEDNCAA